MSEDHESIEPSQGFLELLLLQCGDVEENPGPPKRRGVPSSSDKKETNSSSSKDDRDFDGGAKAWMERSFDCCDFTQAFINFDYNVDYIKGYEDKVIRMEKQIESQKKEIDSLKEQMKNLDGTEHKLLMMNSKIDAITGVYDDLHEKMHEIDKTRKNNLLFYGIKPDFLPEIPTQLEQKIHEIIKFNLNISRDVPFTKISRMITGPEVRGCRPVLVNFVHWKDREEVLRKSTFLRGSNVYITEDLSRKMREHRQELHKYARQIRSRSPNKKCTLRQDKLFIDNHMYVYDEDRHEVVRFHRPASPPRVPSRNYSSVDEGLRRSASAHSVNGEANVVNGHDNQLVPGSASSIGQRMSELQNGSSAKYPSAENIHLSPIPSPIPISGNNQNDQDEVPPKFITNGIDIENTKPSSSALKSANKNNANKKVKKVELVEEVVEKIEAYDVTTNDEKKSSENDDKKKNKSKKSESTTNDEA